jgi:hypothetical protein
MLDAQKEVYDMLPEPLKENLAKLLGKRDSSAAPEPRAG